MLIRSKMPSMKTELENRTVEINEEEWKKKKKKKEMITAPEASETMLNTLIFES